MSKLGEDVTETLERIPAQCRVIQHVREKFACRTCAAITQPPAPFHAIARGRACTCRCTARASPRGRRA